MRSTELKLHLGFLTLLIAIGINTLVSSANMDAVSRNRHRVIHSHQVLTELETIVSLLKDAETGQRGYLLTGRENYLEPYTAALQTIDPHFARLRDLTRDDPQQKQTVTEIERWKQAKFAELQTTIVLMRTGDREAARQVVLSERGKSSMDTIRSLAARMEGIENALLRTRESESQASERRNWFLFVAAALVRIAGLFVVYLIVARAFRERRRSVEALQKREEWLSTTLRGIGDAVLATDENGRILFLNGVAEALTGWKQEAAEGKNAAEVFHIVSEETRAKVDSPIARVIGKGLDVGLANHTILIAQDGTERPIEHSGAPIRDGQGNVTGMVLVFRDNSERRSAEKEQERHLLEVESLNERLRRAMKETHHRVKNNLQLVSALIEIQTNSDKEMLPLSDMLRVRQNIQALSVIHDILTKQPTEDGDAALLSFKGVLEQYLPILQSTLGERTLRSELEEVFLPGKKITSLAMAANELVSNAIKHGKGEIELTLRTEDHQVILEVCDDGPGFPSGFDPQKAANTGLELIENIARHDLQGDVSYLNREHGGARIVITFAA